MGVSTPSAINQAFADAYNARDREAMLSLYHPDGSVVNPDGSIATGLDEVAVHVDQLFQMGGSMTSINQFAFTNGDTALAGALFTLTFDDPDRKPLTGRTAEVLVRLGEQWVYWIDNPFAAPA